MFLPSAELANLEDGWLESSPMKEAQAHIQFSLRTACVLRFRRFLPLGLYGLYREFFPTVGPLNPQGLRLGVFTTLE